MDLALIQEAIATLFSALTALAVAAARGFAMLTVLPVFTRLGLTGLLRNTVAIVLALPLAPFVFAEMTAAQINSTPQAIGLMLKESFIGFTLGAVFAVPFWAATAAGDIADLQRGSNGAFLNDPSNQDETSVTGTLFVLLMLALFYLAGGLNIVVGGLYQSYAIWPVFSFLPAFSADAPLLILGLLDRVLLLGLQIAAPLLLAMFLGDVLLALIARFAPQLNAFDLSLSVKSIIFVTVLAVYLVFLIDDLQRLLDPLLGAVRDVQRMVPGG